LIEENEDEIEKVKLPSKIDKLFGTENLTS